jgi:O-antigen/teichoic acid export membrane protein
VLGNSLITARHDPKIVVAAVGVAAVVNLGLNFALIPSLEGNGAAIAMLASEFVLAAIVVVIAVRIVGGIRVVPTVAAPALAGVAMAAALLPLQDALLAAILAGSAVYLLVYVIVDRRLSPGDLEIVSGMIRRRLPARRPAVK